jgi:hypothetical protein
MEWQTREALQSKLHRHRRSGRWALFGRSRCRACGLLWPCPALRRATRTMDETPAPDWSRLATQPNPAVAPLLTYGQRYRSGRGEW